MVLEVELSFGLLSKERNSCQARGLREAVRFSFTGASSGRTRIKDCLQRSHVVQLDQAVVRQGFHSNSPA